MSKSQDNLWGQARPESTGGAVGELQAIVNGLIGSIQTITLVKVLKVKSQGVEPVGFVDVQPLVAQTNESGQIVPHGVIHNVPFFRLQGGVNAVIVNPNVGDIGMCGFCSRDISSVKATKRAAAPQSRRKYDWADGLYLGGFLNGTPERYIQFRDDGIKIYSPDSIEIIAKTIRFESENAVRFVGGQGIKTDGDVHTNKVSLNDHAHSGVRTGNGNTGKPQSFQAA